MDITARTVMMVLATHAPRQVAGQHTRPATLRVLMKHAIKHGHRRTAPAVIPNEPPAASAVAQSHTAAKVLKTHCHQVQITMSMAQHVPDAQAVIQTVRVAPVV